MATKSKSTFQKRQKEMKRQEKQRAKAERRAQKKLANRAEREFGIETVASDVTAEAETSDLPAGTEQQS
jgi:hypothetical protein